MVFLYPYVLKYSAIHILNFSFLDWQVVEVFSSFLVFILISRFISCHQRMLFVLFLHARINGFSHCGLIHDIVVSVAWTLETKVCLGPKEYPGCKT